MMNGLTKPTEQDKLINKREYHKNYYENNKEAITQNKKRYQIKLKEKRTQLLEILTQQREERGDILVIDI